MHLVVVPVHRVSSFWKRCTKITGVILILFAPIPLLAIRAKQTGSMSSRVVRCYGSRRRTLVGAGDTWKASPVVAELVADALECDDGVVRHVLASELTWDDVFSDNAVVVSSSSGSRAGTMAPVRGISCDSAFAQDGGSFASHSPSGSEADRRLSAALTAPRGESLSPGGSLTGATESVYSPVLSNFGTLGKC